MKVCIADQALFYKLEKRNPVLFCATCVDDILHAGNERYINESKKFLTKFQCKEGAWSNIHFAGAKINYTKNAITIHQKGYIQRFKRVDKNCGFVAFSSLRAQFAWTTNSRPDICGSVALFTLVTELIFYKRIYTY